MPQPPANHSLPQRPAKSLAIFESQERFRGLIQSLSDEYLFLVRHCDDVNQGRLPLTDFQNGMPLDFQPGQPAPSPPGLPTAKLAAMAPAVQPPEAACSLPPADVPKPDFPTSFRPEPEGSEDAQADPKPLMIAKGSKAAEEAAKEAALDASGKVLDADPESLEAMENALTLEYIDKLRKQFDLLDTDQDGLITLDQCDTLVELFMGEKVHREDLLTSLRDLDTNNGRTSHASEQEGAATDADVEITFDLFLHLMGANNHDNSDSDKQISAVLKGAFTKAHAAAEALAHQADLNRVKHERLAFLLDVLPAPVILLNAVVLGLRADLPSQDILWRGLDIFFFVFYTVECVVKVYVFGHAIYCCGPEWMWNWLDMFCILISLVDHVMSLLSVDMTEIGDVMLLKMMRLLKLARLVKALHYPIFAELKFMIAGVASGLRTLLWALVLLVFLIYFVGVTMKILIGEHYPELETVPAAMFTVFRCLTDGCSAYNGTPLQEHIREEYGLIFIVPYVLVIMIVTFGLFNLIMAVFVDNVTGDSARRRQEKLGSTAHDTKRRFQADFACFVMKCKSGHGRQHRLLSHAEKVALAKQAEVDALAAFHSLPEHLSVSRKIFEEWTKTPDFIQMLDDADIDTANTSQLFEALDADMDGMLTPGEIVDGLMRLRGPITKIDMIAVRLKARYCTRMLDHIHRVVVGPTSSDLC